MASPQFKVTTCVKRWFRRAERRTAVAYLRTCDREPVDVSDDVRAALARIADREHAAARRAMPPRCVGRFVPARTPNGSGVAFAFVSA